MTFRVQVWDQPGTPYGYLDNHNMITSGGVLVLLICPEAR